MLRENVLSISLDSFNEKISKESSDIIKDNKKRFREFFHKLKLIIIQKDFNLSSEVIDINKSKGIEWIINLVKYDSDFIITTDSEGNFQINNYVILDTIGKGSYGLVKLTYNLLDTKYYVEISLFRQ